MLDAKVIRKAIKRWPEKLNIVNREFIPTAGNIVLGDAISNAPVDNGTLRGSITLQTEKDLATIGTPLNYAPYVEYGTRPHPINSAVKIKGVGWRYIGQHPGTTEQPYMRPAIDNNRKKLIKLWQSIFRRVYGG